MTDHFDDSSLKAPGPCERQKRRDALLRKLERLRESAFRARFALNEEDREKIAAAGLEKMRADARSILASRIAPAFIANDGRQTPMKGYAVFKAQHATALCCRQCMRKWHGIPENRALTEKELEWALDLLMLWIEEELKKPAPQPRQKRPGFFPGRFCRG